MNLDGTRGDSHAALQGRGVQLMFTGSRAKLYSFYFSSEDAWL